MAAHDDHLKPRRRLFRFSLTTFLVLLTLICFWLGRGAIAARRQYAAIQRIEELGGHVGFHHQLDGNSNWKTNPTLPAPKWLSDFVGEDYFRSIAVVNFDEGSDPSDADLAILRDLRGLTHLTLNNRTKITDAGLQHLASLSNLRVLTLQGTKVTGQGFVHLQQMRSLEGLSASNTPLQDVGLEHIKELPNLSWLIINDTEITDTGLSYVSTLSSLSSLQIRETQITDNGLVCLSRLSNLTQLLLGYTDTSSEGRAVLQASLPNCKVSPQNSA